MVDVFGRKRIANKLRCRRNPKCYSENRTLPHQKLLSFLSIIVYSSDKIVAILQALMLVCKFFNSRQHDLTNL